MHHPYLVFAIETSKDYLCNTLKELKTIISNEEGSKRATLQHDEVLECLRATYEHATKNVLKRHQSLFDRSLVFTPSTLSFSSIEPLMFNLNASLDSKPSSSDSYRLITKAKMLQIQSKNMTIVAFCFFTTFKIQDTFLVSKVDINN
jgi:hypothetical protein